MHWKLPIGHSKVVWDGENWNLNDSLTAFNSKFAEAEHCTAKTILITHQYFCFVLK